VKWLTAWGVVVMLKGGNGEVPVGLPVFNTGVGSPGEPWWVRLPSIPVRGQPGDHYGDMPVVKLVIGGE